MDFEQALRQRLLDAAAVAALAGRDARGALSIDCGLRRQESPLPAVTLRVASDPRPQDLDGFVSLRQSRVQVDCRASSRATVAALREAVIAALVPAGAFHGVNFGRGLVDQVRDLGEHGETGFVHRDSIDFLIWHD